MSLLVQIRTLSCQVLVIHQLRYEYWIHCVAVVVCTCSISKYLLLFETIVFRLYSSGMSGVASADRHSLDMKLTSMQYL